jgi:hypothetical protein
MLRRCRTSVQGGLLGGQEAGARPGSTCSVLARWCHLWVSVAPGRPAWQHPALNGSMTALWPLCSAQLRRTLISV